MRTLTRIVLAVPALLAALVFASASASAALAPADRAWLTGAGATVSGWQLEWPGHLWSRDVTIRSTGALDGQPGNRHTAAVNFVHGYSRFPVPWTITRTDEECTAAGACEVVRTEEISLPASTPDVEADGTVHVVASTPVIDVRLTPVGWTDPRATPDLAGADFVQRLHDTVSNQVYAGVVYRGSQMRVTGSIAGVRADEIVSSSWSDSGRGTGSLGAPLPLATTVEQQLRYAPPQRNGRVVDATTVDLSWEGEARGTLTTSTGERLPGNAYALHGYPQLTPAPGAGLIGTQDVDFSLAARQCPAATTPIDECEFLEGPVAPVIGSRGPMRFVVTPLGALAFQVKLPVYREVADGPPVSLGTVTVTAGLAPTGSGRPEQRGDLNAGTPGGWSIARVLERDLTGPVRVGSLTARATGQHIVRLTSERTGSL
jgi:hypothetical protein